MKCLGRLGCLLLVAVVGILAWLWRDAWVPSRFRSPTVSTSPASAWEPLSSAGADRTRAAMAKLSQPAGPVYQTLSGADVASYVASQFSKQLPPATDSMQVRVTGDRMSMRANVRTADLGGTSTLGPFASMLGDRETIELIGTLHVVRPGLGEFQIQAANVHGLGVPSGMIPRLIARIGRGLRPAGVSRDAVPLPLPRYVGDIRVANGKITLYKNVD